MTTLSGKIGNTGILDLSCLENKEDLSGVEAIENVGVIRVPQRLYRRLMAIPMSHVGIVDAIPEGKTQALTGATRVSGAFLAAGDGETTLHVMGVLLVTAPLEEIGFKGIQVTGQLVLPKGSEHVLAGKLMDLKGQIMYYAVDQGQPRIFMGQERVSREFLELLPERAPWVVLGQMTIEDDVPVDLLREKVSEIALTGEISVPRSLYALVQVLAVEKAGQIIVTGEEARRHGGSENGAL